MLGILVIALAAATQVHATGVVRDSFDPPEYCHGLNCPEFEVVEDVGRDGELRKYAPSTWVYTDTRQGFFEKAATVGFGRLVKYLLGNNELQEQIEMTAPVVTTVRLDEDNRVQPDFTVLFFLPLEYQKDQGDKEYAEPPAPKDENVNLIDYGETEFYVLPFSFYAIGIRVQSLALGFFDYLERNGYDDIDRSKYFVAQYDPPYKPLNRHNEIWVLRTGKEDPEKKEKKDRKKRDDKGRKRNPLWPFSISIDAQEEAISGMVAARGRSKRGVQSSRGTKHQSSFVKLLKALSRPKVQHLPVA